MTNSLAKIEENKRKLRQSKQDLDINSEYEAEEAYRAEIERFWKRVGRLRLDNDPEGDKILKEYEEGLKEGLWINSIDFAAEKLGSPYRVIERMVNKDEDA